MELWIGVVWSNNSRLFNAYGFLDSNTLDNSLLYILLPQAKDATTH